MKFNIISFTSFVFEMVIFFPFLINAWTEHDPPIEPSARIRKDCLHWIEYNGFKLDNHDFNRNKARTRDPSLDKKASKWAAAYAFIIGGLEDVYLISPKNFCKNIDINNHVPKKFIALEKEKKNCRDWITFYGFKNTVFDTYNYDYIFNLDPSQLKHVSIWAYSYYVYLSLCEDDDTLAPWEFCIKMGNRGDSSNPKPFTCKHDSLLTCMEWLEQYDYLVDNPRRVCKKARRLMENKAMYPLLHLHYFPTTYGKELRNLKKSGQPLDGLTQMKFCKKYDGESDDPQKYPFDYSGEGEEEVSGEVEEDSEEEEEDSGEEEEEDSEEEEEEEENSGKE